PRRVIEWQEWFSFSPFALAPIAAVVALRRRCGSRLALAGILVALLFVSPVLGLVPFHFQAFSTVADHYLYPAMLGVALVAAWVGSPAPAAGLALNLPFRPAVARGRRSLRPGKPAGCPAPQPLSAHALPATPPPSGRRTTWPPTSSPAAARATV